MIRKACGSILAVSLLGASPPAKAQPAPVERCAAAYEESQRRQAKGKLIEAKREAAACAAVSCPAEIVRYCTKLVDDLEAAIATIVIVAVDDRGRDIAGVRVTLDGRDAGSIDGQPLAVDPGTHHLGAAAPGMPAAFVDVTVRAGERNRRIPLRFHAPRDRARAELGYTPALVAFSIGAAGFGLGATTGILALQQDADLADVCSSAGTCSARYADDIGRLETLTHVSTAGFVVGGIGVATGVVLALLAKKVPDNRAGLRWSLAF